MFPFKLLLLSVMVAAFDEAAASGNTDYLFNKDSCNAGPHSVNASSIAAAAAAAGDRAPDAFNVRWKTTAAEEDIVLQVYRDWAPLGVDRFYQLILDNYFNCAAFFRVVPGRVVIHICRCCCCSRLRALLVVLRTIRMYMHAYDDDVLSYCLFHHRHVIYIKSDFVVQFGIASDPNETAKWNAEFPDDPARVQSNRKGTVSFATAGANTRTTQLFINLDDNSAGLDGAGFCPIGVILSGMEGVVAAIANPTPDSSDGVDQGAYQDGGNAWILQEYPDIDLIENTALFLGDATGDLPQQQQPSQAATATMESPTEDPNAVLFSTSNTWKVQLAVALAIPLIWTLAMTAA